MSGHDKKLLVILIALLVCFILKLTIDSSNRPSEFIQRHKNKTLVLNAIVAFNSDPYDSNLPEQYDPNYVQYGLDTKKTEVPTPRFYGRSSQLSLEKSIRNTGYIMAEGNLVFVLHSWIEPVSSFGSVRYSAFSIYRIDNDKIVEGWTAPAMISADVLQLPFWE